MTMNKENKEPVIALMYFVIMITVFGLAQL